MSSKIKILVSVFLLIGLLPLELGSCTTFCFKDKNGNIFFGRNFDFPTGLGYIQVNQRNLEKTSFITPGEKQFSWISKYGSISFNQNGREFPYGGINEAGLVVEQMMLNESKYPAIDNRAGLEELQWIQYQLDVSGSVDEVIKSDSRVRITPNSQAPIHFSVSDVNGNFATIEYIEGKMVYHTGKDAIHHVLANDTYDKSLADKAVNNTKSRFVRAANMIETYDKSKGNGVDYAFEILKNVAQGDATQWSIVYDLKKRTVYYKTMANKSIKQINLSDFDFSCSSKRLFANIDEEMKDANDFKMYDFESNYKLIDKVWNSMDFLKNVPAEIKNAFAKYPDEINCAKIK